MKVSIILAALVGVMGRVAAQTVVQTDSTWASGVQSGRFGQDIDVTPDGSYFVTGTPFSGAPSCSVWASPDNGVTWAHQADLVASSGQVEGFGNQVAITADGTMATCPAPTADGGQSDGGGVFVFTRSGTTWSESAILYGSQIAANGNWGNPSVIAKSSAGHSVVAAGGGNGNNLPIVYVFSNYGGSWTEVGLLAENENSFGRHGLDISDDGNTIVVGASSENKVFVFSAVSADNPSLGFSRTATITGTVTALAGIGFRLAINPAGDAFVASWFHAGDWTDDGFVAANNGGVIVYSLSGGTWVEQASFTSPAGVQAYDYGENVEINAAGTRVMTGTTGPRQVYVYEVSQGGSWIESYTIEAHADLSNPAFFGASTGYAENGLVLVGVPSSAGVGGVLRASIPPLGQGGGGGGGACVTPDPDPLAVDSAVDVVTTLSLSATGGGVNADISLIYDERTARTATLSIGSCQIDDSADAVTVADGANCRSELAASAYDLLGGSCASQVTNVGLTGTQQEYTYTLIGELSDTLTSAQSGFSDATSTKSFAFPRSLFVETEATVLGGATTVLTVQAPFSLLSEARVSGYTRTAPDDANMVVRVQLNAPHGFATGSLPITAPAGMTATVADATTGGCAAASGVCTYEVTVVTGGAGITCSEDLFTVALELTPTCRDGSNCALSGDTVTASINVDEPAGVCQSDSTTLNIGAALTLSTTQTPSVGDTVTMVAVLHPKDASDVLDTATNLPASLSTAKVLDCDCASCSGANAGDVTLDGGNADHGFTTSTQGDASIEFNFVMAQSVYNFAAGSTTDKCVEATLAYTGLNRERRLATIRGSTRALSASQATATAPMAVSFSDMAAGQATVAAPDASAPEQTASAATLFAVVGVAVAVVALVAIAAVVYVRRARSTGVRKLSSTRVIVAAAAPAPAVDA